jgi:branched-chain amino acid transport system permease protein
MNELALAIPWPASATRLQPAGWCIPALGAPLIAMLFGKTWVRILDFAMLYVMLAIGLNLVVGFAGLLDLGYIAFYAVGAYTFAFLASPHFEHAPAVLAGAAAGGRLCGAGRDHPRPAHPAAAR